MKQVFFRPDEDKSSEYDLSGHGFQMQRKNFSFSIKMIPLHLPIEF